MNNTAENIVRELKVDRSNWELVKFGDVAIQQKESVDRENTDITRYIKGEHMKSEDLHIREWGDLTDEYLGPAFIRKFEKGDILYGSRRTYLRKVAIAPFEGITSNTTFVIKADEKKINKKLLPFIMLSEGFANHSIKNSKGSVNPYVNWKDLANYEFLLPPKDQQAQIAELLWAMDEVVEREMQVSEKLNFALQSFFKHSVKDIRGKTIPLSKILVRKKEKSKPPHKLENYIGLEHIESGEFTCKKHGSSSDVLAQCNVIEPGDLCYSKLRPYLDKAFIASFKAVSTTELLIYDTRYVSKEYILYHFHSKAFLNYISFKGFGTKMPRVNHKSIGEYPIKIPDNEEQLLEKMKEFKTRIEEIKGKVKKSKSLQKSLINQIF